MKRLRKKRYYIISLIIIILTVLNSCVTLRKTDKQLIKIFKKDKQNGQIYYDTINGKIVRWIADKPYNKKLPTVFFVHGAPGSATDFLTYLQDSTLRTKANLVAVDRLGYGFSNFGKPEVHIDKQAKIIESITQKYQEQKMILVGWSYGGPIIGKMAMDNPNYHHLILLAPAVSPKDEKYFWIGKFAKWKATKWLVPKVFVVAEAEKLAHVKELKKLENYWENMEIPITYFHGDKDRLVPYKNMSFLNEKMDSNKLKTITLKGRNHFIPFTEFKRIKKEIISVLDEME